MEALTGHSAFHSPTANIIPIRSATTQDLLDLTKARDCSELVCCAGVLAFLSVICPTCLIVSGNASDRGNLNSTLNAWYAAMPENIRCVHSESRYGGTALTLQLVTVTIPDEVLKALLEAGVQYYSPRLTMTVAAFHHFSYHIAEFGHQFSMADVLKEACGQQLHAHALYNRMKAHADACVAAASVAPQPQPSAWCKTWEFLAANRVAPHLAVELLRLPSVLRNARLLP